MFGVVLPFALIPAVLLCSCKKTTQKLGRKPTARAYRQGPPQDDFREARGQMMDGQLMEAAEGMRRLNARNDIPAALQDWVLIYGGMAELLVGREAESRPLFAQLAERSAAARGTEIGRAHV